MDPAYGIDETSVVSDIIGGEAVMLHRVSGDYFSADGSGCLIWQWIGEGHSRDWMIKTLGARFTAEPAEIAVAVDAFLADLVNHKLILGISGDVGSQVEEALGSLPDAKAEFVPPVLHVYSDIRRMILLDPIHEAAEAGWPVPA